MCTSGIFRERSWMSSNPFQGMNCKTFLLRNSFFTICFALVQKRKKKKNNTQISTVYWRANFLVLLPSYCCCCPQAFLLFCMLAYNWVWIKVQIITSVGQKLSTKYLISTQFSCYSTLQAISQVEGQQEVLWSRAAQACVRYHETWQQGMWAASCPCLLLKYMQLYECLFTEINHFWTLSARHNVYSLSQSWRKDEWFAL